MDSYYKLAYLSYDKLENVCHDVYYKSIVTKPIGERWTPDCVTPEISAMFCRVSDALDLVGTGEPRSRIWATIFKVIVDNLILLPRVKVEHPRFFEMIKRKIREVNESKECALLVREYAEIVERYIRYDLRVRKL